MSSIQKSVLVTGSSRGIGKAIALRLAASGANVIINYARNAEAAEATKAEIEAAGGTALILQGDVADPATADGLVKTALDTWGRLDVLVNNAWGGHESFTMATLSAPFWEQPLEHWTAMFDHGVRNHLLACRAAAPLLVRQKRGLVAATTYWDRGHYIKGNLFYDVAKAALNRIAFGVAEELRPHGVTSLAVSPGWMRTELILAAFKTDEDHWRDVPPLARTESPRYLGRGIVALAADPDVQRKSGGVHSVGDLAVEYGFTDIDGRVVPPFEM